MRRLPGKLLRPFHAGEARLACNAAVTRAPRTLILSSPAFAAGGFLPARYAGRGVGDNVSPPLEWRSVPDGTAELVLIFEDPDAPFPRPVVHVVATAIRPELAGLPEGALSDPRVATRLGVVLGRNSLGGREYRGPRPIPGHGPHRYVFQIFALGAALQGADRLLDKRRLLERLPQPLLASGRLDGLFER